MVVGPNSTNPRRMSIETLRLQEGANENVSDGFAILVEGNYAPGQIISSWPNQDGGGPGAMTGEARSARPLTAAPHQHAPELSDRECRLVDWNAVNDTLFLAFAPAQIELQMANPHRQNTHDVALTDGLGVCSMVKSSDELLIIQKRSERHIRYPGWYHVCGGMLEIEAVGEQRVIDPFAWMRTELHEELAIDSAFIVGMRCLGLVQDLRNMRPELVFETTLNVPTDHFAQQSGPEHSALVLLDDRADDLRQFAADHGACMVPSGLACLLLYGKQRFGRPWYQETVGGIAASGTGAPDGATPALRGVHGSPPEVPHGFQGS